MPRTLLATLFVSCAALMATLIVVTAPAIAETLSDPETGLTVTVPSGYSSFGIEYEKNKNNQYGSQSG